MKKPVIALIVMVIAAAASLGMFFIAKDKKDKDDKKAAEKAADKILFSFNSDDINKVEFTCADGSYTAELVDSEWKLTSGGDFAIDQSYLANVCTYASSLKASGSYSKDESKLAAYGLDEPGVIVLYDSNNSYKLNVGTVSPTGDSFYVMLDDRDKVYVVDSLYGSVLKTSRMMLRSKDLIPYSDNGIAEIILNKDGKEVYHLTYNKDEKNWSLPAKYSALSFDATAVDTMITSLTRLKVSLENMGEESPSDLSEYGLDKPEYTACIKGLDGTERNFLINTKYDASNNTSSVYIKENDQIVFFSTGSLSFTDKTPFTFLSKSTVNAELKSITGFEYECSGISAEFTVDNENGTVASDGKESPLSTEFQTFFDSLANENMTSVDVDASPELDEPKLTVVFHNTDGSDKTYQLTDAGNDQLYVFIDGKYTGCLVSADVLSGKNSIPYFYDEFIAASKIK